ncbi:MAG: divalent-cation tolerance protein CutA [Candidatus Micrarchaeota archaeon]
MIFVYVTCMNAKEAEKIGSALVKKRLAACAVVIPKIKSFFSWKGKMEKTAEALLFLKASAKNRKNLEKEIKKMHSYKVPCILFFSPDATKEYSAWVERESAF